MNKIVQEKMITNVIMSLDEWSNGRKRYIGSHVKLHDLTFDMGLKRIPGKAGADELKKLLGEQLLSFGMDWKDVKVISVDGAMVNRALSEVAGVKAQMCLSHAVSLSVQDILLSKKAKEVQFSYDSEVMTLENVRGHYEKSENHEKIFSQGGLIAETAGDNFEEARDADEANIEILPSPHAITISKNHHNSTNDPLPQLVLDMVELKR